MSKPKKAKKEKQSEIISVESRELDEGNESEEIEQLHENSLLARWELEKWSVIGELWRVNLSMITFYMSSPGGNLSMEEAIKKASEEMDDQGFEEYLDSVVSWNMASISWQTLDTVFRQNPTYAQQVWEDIKEQAEKDFKSGHLVARLFESADWQNNPWKRAQFVAVRDSFIEHFKPEGGIDYSMIDMLAVTFFLWMHWTEEHIRRATTDATGQMSEAERKHTEKWKGEWIAPRVSDQEAIEQAAQLADRYRRAHQSQIRAMRDWRRFSVPVTINNLQQVNIAAEGGQQVNAVKVES